MRLPLANDLVVVEPDQLDAIVDVLANDQFAEVAEPQLTIASEPTHGEARVVFGGSRLHYTPSPGFLGRDQLTYRAEDENGRVVEANVEILVGLSALDAATLTSATNGASTVDQAFLADLESPISGPISSTPHGSLINRPVTIQAAKQIEGAELVLEGTGKLIIDLPTADSEFRIEGAKLVWRPGENSLSAIEVRRGRLVIEESELTVLVDSSIAADDESPDHWLIEATVANGSTHLTSNQFNSGYWRSSNLVRSDNAQLTFRGNEVNYFHNALQVYSTSAVDASDNRFFGNTGHAIDLSATVNALVQGNQIRIAGSDGVRLSNSSGAEVRGNVIANAEGNGLLIVASSDSLVTDNFIHSSRQDAIRLLGQPTDRVRNMTLSRNILAQNGGWAVSSSDVNALQLIENLIHQNRVDGDGNQHHFHAVSGVVDRANLQDQDNTAEDIADRKTFGENAQSYSFLAASNHPHAVKSRMAIDLNNVTTPRPTRGSSESESLLNAIEQGGQVEIPAAGVTIDRVVRIRHAVEVFGGPIEIVAGGQVIVEMNDEADDFVLRGASVTWSLELGSPGGAVDAFQLRRGRMVIEDNDFVTNVKPSEAHYAATDDLLFRSAPSIVFRLGEVGGRLPQFHMRNNRFANAYWYSTQLLKSSSGLTMTNVDVSGNEVQHYHGAIYLAGLDGAQVTNNRLFRNSFGNIVLSGQNVRIDQNRLLFPGNGTSGDGITLGDVRNISVTNNVVTNGTCYGVWFLNRAENVQVSDNVFHAGVTTAINFDPPGGTVESVGFERIELTGNLISHNAALATRIVEARDVVIQRNVLQANNGEGEQHLHLGVAQLSEAENRLAVDAIASPDSLETSRYAFLSPHFVVDDDAVVVYGTPGGDNFVVDPNYRGMIRIQLGEWRASFSPDVIRRVKIVGEGGADYTRLLSSAAPSVVTFEAGRVTASNTQLETELVQMASVRAEGAERDRAVFVTTDLDATLRLNQQQARLIGSGIDYRARGFGHTETDLPVGSSVVRVSADPSEQTELNLGQTPHVKLGGATHAVHATGGVLFQVEASEPNSRIRVFGSPDDDKAEFAVGFATIETPSATAEVTGFAEVVVSGNGGRDQATFFDTSDDDEFWARPTYAYLKSDQVVSEARQFHSVEAVFSTGVDAARFYDSAGDEQLIAEPQSATFAGDSFQYAASGYDELQVKATAGDDRAWLYGSPGDDRFVGRPSYSYLQGDGFLLQADGFDQVVASGKGGEDMASLYDSVGDDLFVGRTNRAYLDGSAYLNEARDFAMVTAFASEGQDRAKLYDSPGDDRFIARPEHAYLETTGNTNIVRAFDSVRAFASGGRDHAQFSDSDSADLFVARESVAYMQGSGFVNEAKHFETTQATAFRGGDDRAVLYDTSANDTFVARPGNAYMMSGQRSNEAVAFPNVVAKSTAGGEDQATFYGSAQPDVFVARPSSSYLQGFGFLNEAEDFPFVEVIDGDANDTARLYGSAALDQVSAGFASVDFVGVDYRYLANGFGQVDMHSSGGGDTVELRSSGAVGVFGSRASYDYLQGSTSLLQAHNFTYVTSIAGANDNIARLFEVRTGELLTNSIDSATLMRFGKRTRLVGFDRVRAIAAEQHRPMDFTAATDFALQLVGDWLR